MLFRSMLALVGALSLCVSPAQRAPGIGFQLEAHLRTAEPGSRVDLFLQGEGEAVQRAVALHGGRVKHARPDWVCASVPVEQVRALVGTPAVTGVQFSLSKGQALNDSAAVKARIRPVHEGLAPLPGPYTGKGVLVGIIDTGLDLGHPDFQDSLGRTRVLHYWDQNFPVNAQWTPAPYGYGQAWDSTAINAGLCPATDTYNHGTGVASIAAGNGLATGHFGGAAPDADLIIVSSDLNDPNWRASIVDAVQYILHKAEELGRPVSINLSLGDAYGSHDGLDPAALFINDLLLEAPGRALTCALGNSGQKAPYHLRTEVGEDTTFTWFRWKQNSALGMHAVYFDLWADTADFSQVHFSIGADRHTGGPLHRAQLPFRTVQSNLDVVLSDTLKSFSGNRLGVVHTFAQRRGGQYHMEVFIPLPDSADHYRYRFSTTGQGLFDVWSSADYGTSEIVSNIPTPEVFPDVAHYVLPDNTMSLVDSWACSPHVISVGNYINESTYVDYNGQLQQFPVMNEGAAAASSSRGPTRTGGLKPDVAAPGDNTIAASTATFLAWAINANPVVVAQGGMHARGGGTSAASPVVAGIVALYLEKCPRATVTEIMEALAISAYADAFTGEVPNIRFGHGKADAFAALVGSNFTAMIEGPAAVCEGDTVMLSGTDFMYSYHWSNGATGLHIPFTGGDVSLVVENGSGCLTTTDTFHVEVLPLPVVTVQQDGVLLTASEGVAYQWYAGGQALEDAQAMQFEAFQNGYYQVEVTAANGCTAMSDSVEVFSVGTIEMRTAEWSLYPVPADDRLWVAGHQGTSAYRVRDMAGRVVLQGRLIGQEPIAVSALPPGIYVLELPVPHRTFRFSKR